MIRSSASGTAGLCQWGATGGTLMCWVITEIGSSDSNGARPATASYTTAPSA